MTGYVRQSSASIVTGEDILAAPLNSEFNRLESAFNGTTGHLHTGGVGDGPLINLSGVSIGITGILGATNGGGGGATYSANTPGAGGLGGGGNGGTTAGGSNGTTNTGGGGGGARAGFVGGTGGSGIVIIKYQFQA